MLFLDDNSPFASGCCAFRRAPRAVGDLNKVFLTVEVAGNATEVAVDTGGVYFVCPPDLADLIGLLPENADDIARIIWQGELEGHLHRTEVVIPADDGDSLQFEPTIFVPGVPAEQWTRPPILGWHGALERFRFALDPLHDMFYFGPT